MDERLRKHVRDIRAGSSVSKEEAALALWTKAAESDLAVSQICAAGAVQPLLELANSGPCLVD